MKAYTDKLGLVHALTHANYDLRAARTACGHYIDVWPRDVHDGATTCITCVVSTPDTRFGLYDDPDAVYDRRYDHVRHCGHRHLSQTDRLKRCLYCGYSGE